MKHNILIVMVNVIALSLLGTLFLNGPFLNGPFLNYAQAVQPPQPSPSANQQIEPSWNSQSPANVTEGSDQEQAWKLASSNTVMYGEVVTYTLHVAAPSARSVALYDHLPEYTTYLSDSLAAPAGMRYDPAHNAISGALSLAAAVPLSVSYAVRVGQDGSVGPTPLVTNTAILTGLATGRALSATAVVSVSFPPLGEWHTECVDCPKQFAMTDRSLRLDSSGQPHLAYGGKHLYYAWRDGSSWHYETVDEATHVGDDASLALDGSGQPHISYYDSSNGDLKYAWHDGTNWHVEIVDRQGKGYVGNTSLALDKAGRPHISYDGSYNEGIKYAWHDGSAWHFEIVDSAGGYSSLALDNAGRPHISYGGYNLKYAWHDGITWHIETAAWEWQGVGEFPSLALDGSGRPHISYPGGDPNNYDLKYAWYDGTSWHVETVDSEEYTGDKFPSLALDGSGRPHISYYDNANYDLIYAWHDGTAWYTETVDSEGAVGVSSSLAFDGSGRPHISYYGNDDIKYTWYDGTSWHAETVDSQGGVGEYNSLALDDSGRPHISYFDSWPNYDLKYAWREAVATETIGHNGSAWNFEIVDSLEYGSLYPSLALDDAMRPHISYIYRDNNLKYAWYDGVSWHFEIVDSAGNMSEFSSLALDGAGRPHVSYYSDGALKYARREAVAPEAVGHDGSAWCVEIVDGGWKSPSNSLALDEADRPHISYYDWDNGDLKYAWREAAAAETATTETVGCDGTSWLTETVDSEGDVGQYNSLALDEAGRPHISYFDNTNLNLKYAWHDGVTWQVETVDNQEAVGLHPSLALDDAGRPHISYQNGHQVEVGFPHFLPYWVWMADDLKYAWHDGAAWHIETVDSQGEVRAPSSLALDGSGRPHISYIDQSIGNLKYAFYEPSLMLRMHATTGNEVHNHELLTYTLVLSGTGTNARLWTSLPDGLRYVTSSLSSTLSPPAVYSPTAHAITWRGVLPADMLGEISFQAVVDIQSSGSPFETPIIANTAWLTDTDYGRAISSTAAIRVRFPRLFLSKAAEPLDGLANRDAVTYTLVVSGAGQSATMWDPLPMGVHYISGSLTSTLSSPAVYSPTAHAITWAGVLPADTLGQVRFQVTRGITGPGSLNLSLPIINTAWLTDTDNGTHVEAAVIVNGRRLYLPLVMRNM